MYLDIESNPCLAMGRRQEKQENTKNSNSNGFPSTLSIKVPSFFRCPISLDVMKSPVSLCTGVTYDRSSIQRWLESGNNTCPATMQPLPSTDLIPNLTLQRLISRWVHVAPAAKSLVFEEIRSSDDPVPAIEKLIHLLSDQNMDEDFEKSSLFGPAGGARLLVSVLAENSSNLRIAESVVVAVDKILTVFSDKELVRKAMATAMISRLDGTVSALRTVLKEGTSLDVRRNAASVLDAIIRNVPAADGESKVIISEKKDLLSELIRLASEDKLDRAAVEAALSCLVGLSEVRRARIQMVRLGIVSVSTKILTQDVSPYASAKALRLLEVASGCADGREEICELGKKCIGAILSRMMKAGREGTESAVVVLWSVCHLFRDLRAQEAVAASNGGLTKILLLMQSNCSAAVRQMTGDLLKIFRVNSKSCLSGYDTKTTHIMPF